jgi:hypothetical protein
MTLTLPAWEAWPLAALAALGASTLASLAIAGAVTILKRRAGGQPSPGAVKTPVPGQRAAGSPAVPGRAPGRPAPAPALFPALPPPPPSPPGHPRRRLRKRIDVLFCGCTYIYDGRDQEWNVITCGTAGIDWDAGLRRLTRD